MTRDDCCHESGVNLSGLSALSPDRERAERVRVQCRTELARSRRRPARTARMTGFAWRVLAPAVVGAFCVFYAALLLAMTLRFEGVFD